YTPMCLESGGIVDDLLVYACGTERLFVVNAANFEKDLAWIRGHAPSEVTVVDENEETAQLAVQGPRAEEVLARLYGEQVKALDFYTFFETGAGEDGFEVYVKASRALATWDRVFEAGRPALIRPIGLGARDTLRLEMGYCLYGNDIDETTHPLEAGLGWTVRLDKGAFIGKEALVKAQRDGFERKLVGLVLDGQRIARHGAEVTSQGRPVGTVTSGTMGISIGKPVAMAYTHKDHAGAGSKLEVRTRGQETPAAVTPRPMYRGGSVRSPKPRRAT
ncbi:MAG TPA: glycine cleavage T C-terminal barrel domain-containing protein, partial [Candidatus Limnocylindrales bacterium]|nr:glycine cleavage T C-terminal barrel domain-containing protein [Candidatus Limnocylindrales bacterium]